MKALVLESYNTEYILKDVKTPVAGKGEVLVKIHASGVNPLDLKIKSGTAAHAKTVLPAILGIDMAGVVEAVGEGVSGFSPGDEVYGMTGGIAGVQGSLAEYAAVDADLLALKPGNTGMREAAAIPLSFITAWEGLVDRAGIGEAAGAGDGRSKADGVEGRGTVKDAVRQKTVLVHGGAGGVGHVAVQLAMARGAKVFATVHPKYDELIKSYGATPIDHTSRSVEDYVDQYTNGEGFDIIFDTLGGETLDASFKAVKRYTGHVLSILGWGSHSLASLSFRGASYSGIFTLYPLISGVGRKHHGEIMREATALIEAGKLKPLLDPRRFDLRTVADAYALMEGRQAKGKLVI